MKHEYMSPVLVVLLVAIGAAVAAPLSGGDGSFTISWHTIDGGGGTSSSDALQLQGSIAQADAATTPASNGGFDLTGGFWAGASGTPQTCAGDVTGDTTIDVEDLVQVILAWGTSDPAADLNGDGVVNVEDMILVVVNWGVCE